MLKNYLTAILNGDVSYNALDTDEMLGEDILADKHTDVEMQVINKIAVEQLRKAFLLLSPDEIELLKLRYFKEYSEIKLSKYYGVSQQAISKRVKKILSKIKKIINN